MTCYCCQWHFHITYSICKIHYDYRFFSNALLIQFSIPTFHIEFRNVLCESSKQLLVVVVLQPAFDFGQLLQFIHTITGDFETGATAAVVGA